MKIIGAFNQEKALVGAFSVIVQLRRLIVYTALVRNVYNLTIWAQQRVIITMPRLNEQSIMGNDDGWG